MRSYMFLPLEDISLALTSLQKKRKIGLPALVIVRYLLIIDDDKPKHFSALSCSADERFIILTGHYLEKPDPDTTNAIIVLVDTKGGLLKRLNQLTDKMRSSAGFVYFKHLHSKQYLDGEGKYPLITLFSNVGSYFCSIFIDMEEMDLDRCINPTKIRVDGEATVSLQHRKGLSFLVFYENGNVVLIKKKKEE